MIPFGFIIFGILARLLPHIANVSPLNAIALFSGANLPKRQTIIIPLVILFASDIILGFHATVGYVYGSFILTSLLGLWVRKNKTSQTLIIATLGSSILFFFITNFGVWASTSMYPKTFSGLLECYMMALPFFRNSLVGDLFYSGVFFGGYEVVRLNKRIGFSRIIANGREFLGFVKIRYHSWPS